VPFRGETEVTSGAYAWYALLLLTIVSLLNYLDRTLIYILFTPIKQEMFFSDFELALLGTTSFVIFFTVLGVPFGRLADRGSRKNMIAAGLAVWSLFSGLTGFANGFWSLFFCRLMVGVGEATLGPAALSLLSDYFPPQKRASVQSIYASGITIGGGLAFFLGGSIGMRYGWRTAFYFLGFPGAASSLLAIPFWIILLFSNGVPWLLFANAILLALSLMWIAPSMADVHEMTGPYLRGLGIGVFVCLVNVAAYGIGSPLIGKLNDVFGAATNPGMMRYGFLVSPFCCMLASIFLWRGSKVLEKNRE
jgi:MFS family permease